MITLATDFGSPYPAAMKGVIRRETDAEMIDVAHDLPRGDPRAAAFWLRFVLPEFPPAVHCAVVDPGVGTDRAAVAVRAGDHVIVAPDNGLALPPARALAASSGTAASERASADVDVFEVAVDDPASATFHGRDVFAPTAARIHEALEPRRIADSVDATATADALAAMPSLTRTDEHVGLVFPEPAIDDASTAVGEVLVVDDFGNAITNVPGSFVRDGDRVRVNGESVPVGETFASVPRGDRLVTVGSHGYVECDVNDGRGDEAFGLSVGDEARISIER
ncbi:SAM hydrolase/SAM-dependent halogenase family protein [Halorubrum sp. DTA98]|uniref:SAM hydrolase/SAM-dependent halogenase family protein n=1 Tax=Halorubrum sp. DTA98 TaxID=3402163 RepID=UPI003AABFB58